MTDPMLWLCLDCWDIHSSPEHPGECDDCGADGDRLVPQTAASRLRCYPVPAPERTRYPRMWCTGCQSGVSATMSRETDTIRLECACTIVESWLVTGDELPPSWERAPSREVVLDRLTDHVDEDTEESLANNTQEANTNA